MKKRKQNIGERQQIENEKSRIAKNKIVDDTTATQTPVMNIILYKRPKVLGKHWNDI